MRWRSVGPHRLLRVVGVQGDVVRELCHPVDQALRVEQAQAALPQPPGRAGVQAHRLVEGVAGLLHLVALEGGGAAHAVVHGRRAPPKVLALHHHARLDLPALRGLRRQGGEVVEGVPRQLAVARPAGQRRADGEGCGEPHLRLSRSPPGPRSLPSRPLTTPTPAVSAAGERSIPARRAPPPPAGPPSPAASPAGRHRRAPDARRFCGICGKEARLRGPLSVYLA